MQPLPNPVWLHNILMVLGAHRQLAETWGTLITRNFFSEETDMEKTKNESPAGRPSCGFRIFTRRYPKCESCGAHLPAALLYSAGEIEGMRDAEAAAENQRMAKKKAATAAGNRNVGFGVYGDSGGAAYDGGGCAGDGGGCS